MLFGALFVRGNVSFVFAEVVDSDREKRHLGRDRMWEV